MSDCTSAALSARLYTRMSSSWPANHSGQIEFPPKRSGPDDWSNEPVNDCVDTWLPLR